MQNRLEELRTPLGLSQYRLGKKVGVSRMSIHKIETGKSVPSLKLAYDIANALGVCVYQVFDFDDSGKYMCDFCRKVID
ncbi:MAG TPA: helix-turn-helix transcriptional regulator [Clostridiales bacterium]|nr:helix-turn-helix transcriptional regulator [Clostridiales bacterium]